MEELKPFTHDDHRLDDMSDILQQLQRDINKTFFIDLFRNRLFAKDNSETASEVKMRMGIMTSKGVNNV